MPRRKPCRFDSGLAHQLLPFGPLHFTRLMAPITQALLFANIAGYLLQLFAESVMIGYFALWPLHIPAGSKITGIGVYDNSPKNKWNPAPHLPVYWSEQSWDEMYQAFTEYSVDSQMVIEVKTSTQQQKQ